MPAPIDAAGLFVMDPCKHRRRAQQHAQRVCEGFTFPLELVLSRVQNCAHIIAGFPGQSLLLSHSMSCH